MSNVNLHRANSHVVTLTCHPVAPAGCVVSAAACTANPSRDLVVVGSLPVVFPVVDLIVC